MKNITLILVSLAAVAAHAQHHAAAPTKGVQRATIVVDNGFSPAAVKVRAGKPVQLTFDVKHRACATSVIFSGLKLNKPLVDGKKTVVTFTPKKAGTYAFACPMNMLKGSVVVK